MIGDLKLISPMLGKAPKGSRATPDDVKKLIETLPWNDENLIAEEKFDGVRLQLESSGKTNHGWTRLGHDRLIESGYDWLRDWKLPPGTVLDGELVLPAGSSNVEDADVGDLVLAVFDVMSFNGVNVMSEPLMSRRSLMRDALPTFRGSSVSPIRPNERVKIVEGVVEEKRKFFEKVLENGGEGVMLKRLNAPYQPGKRSWDWVKVKRYVVVTVLITGDDAPPTLWTVMPGKVGTDGKLYPEGKQSTSAQAGLVGLTYGYTLPDGKWLTIGSLGKTGPKAEMDKWVGKTCDVGAWGCYDSGALRHPSQIVMRLDKKPDDVTYESIMEDAILT